MLIWQQLWIHDFLAFWFSCQTTWTRLGDPWCPCSYLPDFIYSYIYIYMAMSVDLTCIFKPEYTVKVKVVFLSFNTHPTSYCIMVFSFYHALFIFFFFIVFQDSWLNHNKHTITLFVNLIWMITLLIILHVLFFQFIIQRSQRQRLSINYIKSSCVCVCEVKRGELVCLIMALYSKRSSRPNSTSGSPSLSASSKVYLLIF